MKTLRDLFYELIDMGYIYEEDENGRGMSYGEFAAVEDWLLESVEEQINEASDFDEAIELYKEIVTYGADDDSLGFAGISEDEAGLWMFYEDIDDDGELIWKCENEEEIPECLKDFWEEYKEEHEYALCA